jgi:3-methyladenine DNA glycosylase AlkD
MLLIRMREFRNCGRLSVKRLSSHTLRLKRKRPGASGNLRPDKETRTHQQASGVEALTGGSREAEALSRMGDLYTNLDAANRAGVPALAEEIDERLSGMPGAKTEDLREVRREFSHRLKDAAPHVVIEVATLLLEVPRIEYRFLSYELIHHHPSALSHLSAWQLEQLGRGIATWSAVDCFAIYLAGPVWRERHVPNGLIHGWARSADRWWRRAALVSTVPLNSKAQGGNGDVYRTLQVCRLLEGDSDPMVAKALSWALRELAKRDPRVVRDFLARRKDVLPSLVLREVSNKLATGLKNPKPKGRAAAKRKAGHTHL